MLVYIESCLGIMPLFAGLLRALLSLALVNWYYSWLLRDSYHCGGHFLFFDCFNLNKN